MHISSSCSSCMNLGNIRNLYILYYFMIVKGLRLACSLPQEPSVAPVPKRARPFAMEGNQLRNLDGAILFGWCVPALNLQHVIAERRLRAIQLFPPVALWNCQNIKARFFGQSLYCGSWTAEWRWCWLWFSGRGIAWPATTLKSCHKFSMQALGGVPSLHTFGAHWFFGNLTFLWPMLSATMYLFGCCPYIWDAARACTFALLDCFCLPLRNT